MVSRATAQLCVLTLLTLAAICAEAAAPKVPKPKFDGPVAVLHNENFKDYLSTKSHALVEFYAPWCKHCKKMRNTLQKVAKTLQSRKTALHFAKVDVASFSPPDTDDAGRNLTETEKNEWISGTKVGDEFHVRSFPTLKLFHYGRVNDKVMFERKPAQLLRQLELLVRLPSVELKTVDEVYQAIKENRKSIPIVIGFYERSGTKVASTFNDIGEGFRSMILFFHTYSPEAMKHFNVTNNFVIIRPKSSDFVPTEGTAMSSSSGGSGDDDDADESEKKKKKRETSSFLPVKKAVTQRDRLSWIPKLTELSTEIVVFDGDARQENIGQKKFRREKFHDFVATHGFNPIGILSENNRHIFNTRAPALVMMFLENLHVPTSARGHIGEFGAQKNGKQLESEEDVVVSGDDEEENAPVGQCTAGGDATPTTKSCEETVMDADDENDDDSDDEDLLDTAAPTLDAEVSSDVRYYANRFKRLIRKPQFQNYSFIFVDPTRNQQMFSGFGFTRDDLILTDQDSARLQKDPSFSISGMISGSSRNNAIGVMVGQDKYRYPYDYFEVGLMETFLTNINKDKINTFFKSQTMPGSQPKIGSGKMLGFVLNNFDEMVTYDTKRDTVVVFVSHFDHMSKIAVENLNKIAEAEKGNKNLVIGMFDAMNNDPPAHFPFAELPTVFFARKKDKVHFFKGKKPPRTGSPRRTKEDPKKEQAMAERFDRGNTPKTGINLPVGEPSTMKEFLPIEYFGDYSVESLAEFIDLHSSSPTKNDFVEAAAKKRKEQGPPPVYNRPESMGDYEHEDVVNARKKETVDLDGAPVYRPTSEEGASGVKTFHFDPKKKKKQKGN